MSTSGSKLTGLRRIDPVTGRPCGPALTTTPAKKGDGHGVKPMPRFFYSEDTYHGNAVAKVAIPCGNGYLSSKQMHHAYTYRYPANAGALLNQTAMRLRQHGVDDSGIDRLLTGKRTFIKDTSLRLDQLADLGWSVEPLPAKYKRVRDTIELLCFYVAGINLQVSVDKLTQVNNRQNLLSYLSYKINNHEETVYLIMMDIDKFKTINDTYGHLAGDDALICVAKALKQACAQFKKRPFIARYGGDEFVVILEGTTDDLAAVEERIHAEAARFNGPDRPYRISLSIGSAAYIQGMSAQELIEVADGELYKIKHAHQNETGRKRVQDRW